MPEIDYPLPTVHLNGTGRETLHNDYSRAQDTVEAAIQAVAEIEFNARDYYVQTDPDAYNKARAKRTEMLDKLREVDAYLLAHLYAIE
jgi:FAD/FMN-containing dehydrogenase